MVDHFPAVVCECAPPTPPAVTTCAPQPEGAVADEAVFVTDEPLRDASPVPPGGPVGCTDVLHTDAHAGLDLQAAFEALRFGGSWTVTDPDRRAVRRLASAIAHHGGFHLESPTRALPAPATPNRPWWSPLRCLIDADVAPKLVTMHRLTARKVRFTRPGVPSDRCTFDVSLVPDPRGSRGYIVRKAVPPAGQLAAAMRARAGGRDVADLDRQAKRLAHDIFPMLLSREAGFLDRLQRTLPAGLRSRVPRRLDVTGDSVGRAFVMHMTWLTRDAAPLSPIDFAVQAAELLAAVHRSSGIVHLDLRDDNVVLTDEGVGFVDFGSAVGLYERPEDSPRLFEMVRRMLGGNVLQHTLARMLDAGRTTHPLLRAALHRPEPVNDLFALALLIHRPHAVASFGNGVRPPTDAEQAGLNALTDAFLTPRRGAAYLGTSSQLLRAARVLQRDLADRRAAA